MHNAQGTKKRIPPSTTPKPQPARKPPPKPTKPNVAPKPALASKTASKQAVDDSSQDAGSAPEAGDSEDDDPSLDRDREDILVEFLLPLDVCGTLDFQMLKAVFLNHDQEFDPIAQWSDLRPWRIDLTLAKIPSKPGFQKVLYVGCTKQKEHARVPSHFTQNSSDIFGGGIGN
jgi:hypothetical protein